MYTPDGYMSAQLERPGRPAFASGDWFRGTAEEIQKKRLATSPTQAHSAQMKRSSTFHIRCPFPKLDWPNTAARRQDRGRQASSEFNLADQVGWKGDLLISDLEASGAQ
jgi:hypothetical protein